MLSGPYPSTSIIVRPSESGIGALVHIGNKYNYTHTFRLIIIGSFFCAPAATAVAAPCQHKFNTVPISESAENFKKREKKMKNKKTRIQSHKLWMVKSSFSTADGKSRRLKYIYMYTPFTNFRSAPPFSYISS